MADIKQVRKKKEAELLQFMKEIDPTGYNSNTYKLAFSNMSDKQFIDMCSDMVSKDDYNFSVEIKTIGA